MKMESYQHMYLFEKDEPSFNYGKIILFDVKSGVRKAVGFWHVDLENHTLFAKVKRGSMPPILPKEAAQQLQLPISIVDLERA